MTSNNTCTCNTGDPTTDFTIQLVISLIGAGVGALLGAYFGLRFAREWDRKKKKEEEHENKIRTLNAIIEEFKTIQQYILTTPLPKFEWNPVQRSLTENNIAFPTTAFQSIVHSGDFSLLSSSLQKELSWVYTRIRRCQLYNDEIANFYFTPLFNNNNSSMVDREATSLISRINNQIVELDRDVKICLPKLESAKTE